MFYQAKPDGRIEYAEEPTSSNREDHLSVLRSALTSYGWVITEEISAGKPYIVKVHNGDMEFKLTIYLIRISNGGKERPDDEKRIQINRNLVFAPKEDGKHHVLLMGIYQNEAVPVLVAWDVERYRVHGQISCQTKANSLAEAMQVGFSRYEKTDGSLAYAFRPELFYFFLKNKDNFFKNKEIKSITINLPQEIIKTKFSRNRITFGAPGTGKSFKLNQDKRYFRSDNVERITFHPNYSYTQFVGTYKPLPIYKNHQDSSKYSYQKYRTDQIAEIGDEHYYIENEPQITYEYVGGPFLNMLIRAIKDYETNGDTCDDYLILIEEINRANVASVFGDVFQLLDRQANGESEYRINTSQELTRYLSECELNNPHELYIPPNFYIWATMNSADQGVYPMDSAFKRRWNFEYVGIDEGETNILDIEVNIRGYGKCNWNNFRKELNRKLIECNVKEDKLIGPFFLSLEELDDSKRSDSIESNFQRCFKNKLIMYLVEDVLKHSSSKLFGDFRTLSNIYSAYESDNGIKIFSGLNELAHKFVINNAEKVSVEQSEINDSTSEEIESSI